MALKLKTDTRQGVSAEYYRIEAIHWAKRTTTAIVVLALYLNEEVAKMANSTPLESMSHTVHDIKAGFTMDDLYKALRTGTLEQAVDC